MAAIEIREYPVTARTIAEYCVIPMEFRVVSRYDPKGLTGGGEDWRLEEETVEPYEKNYDTVDNPSQWATQFDTGKWKMFSAWHGGERIGGCVMAWDTPGVDMLEDRSDLAVVWDIRVHPDHRHNGVGSLLFSKAMEWAKECGCTLLKVETQNINVPACRFYLRMGCELRVVRHGFYSILPEEVQLLWYREL
jgi:GNAT superfamily N-acetyltransferase